MASGKSDRIEVTKFNIMDSTYIFSCSGDTVTLSTDATPYIYDTNSVTSLTRTWEDVGLRIENGIVKQGMYTLTFLDRVSNNNVTETNFTLVMNVNIERDISLAEFNAAMDGGKLTYEMSYDSQAEKTVGFGSFDGVSGTGVDFTTGDWRHLVESLNLDWEAPNNSFKLVLYRDDNGKICGRLPDGTILTEDEPIYGGLSNALLEIGKYGRDGNTNYGLALDFDISQYDLDSAESGFEFFLYEERERWSFQALFTGFTPASTSTAGSLSAPKQWWIQSGDTEGNGFFIEFDKMNTHVLGIRNLDVSTHDGAQGAISASQKALNIVSEMRSKIGAQQNRLEYAASNSRNMAENAQNAESRIRDTDMAEEMVANATASILVQAGQSILAQNNHKADGVLELLR